MRVLVLALLMLAGAATAEGRFLDDKEAVNFRGVGRLNVYGSRFCTATLISETLVLTAAHCLYSPISHNLVRLHGLVFVAGQRRDTQAAVRSVVRMVVLPGFEFNPRADLKHVASDIALLELDAPIKGKVAAAFPVGRAGDAGKLRVVSYSRERAYAPSIEGPCPVVRTAGGVMTLGCGVISGASGAPVVARINGERRLVAVVSAMGRETTGRNVALTVPAAPKMAALKAALAKEPRVEPGAKAKAAKVEAMAPAP